MHKAYHLDSQPIPERMRIYEERFNVTGISVRKDIATAFCLGREPHIELHWEPTNPADHNAIAVYGHWRGWIFRKSGQIGYIPKEIAAKVSKTNLQNAVLPRLLKTYVGTDGYVEVSMQLIGPVEHYDAYSPKVTTLRDEIDTLVNEGNSQEAERLLLQAIENEERNSAVNGGVAARPYKALMTFYRKQKRPKDAVAVLYRFGSQRHARGKTQDELRSRFMALVTKDDDKAPQ